MNYLHTDNNSITHFNHEDKNIIFSLHESFNILKDNITPSIFISTILLLQSIHELYNVSFSSLNDIKLILKKNVNDMNTYIVPSKNIYKVTLTNVYPYLYLSDKVTSVFYISDNFEENALSKVVIECITAFYKKYSTNENIFYSYIQPLLTSFGEDITSCIESESFDYLNIDTLPLFYDLTNQIIELFLNSQSILTISKPPVELHKLERVLPNVNTVNTKSGICKGTNKTEYDNQLETVIERKYKNYIFYIENLIGYPTVFKYPKIDSTIGYIYPEEDINKIMITGLESIFQYWLMGGNIEYNMHYFYVGKQYLNQYFMQKLFYLNEVNKLTVKTWNLNEVKSIKNKDNLEEIVGKFLYGKKRTYNQNKLIKRIIQSFSDYDDLTFYFEIKNYYKPDPFDRSKARIRELNEINVWEFLSNVQTYFDFGGGNGQNAFAIANELKLKKGQVFVSDIQSWFGSEHVSKYNHLCTYRYLKTYKLPFQDNTFDFITVFQVLHHIRKYKLSISELYRVCKQGGIILIREHDCDSEQTSICIDVEHSLHEISKKENVDPSYLQTYYAHYFSRNELYTLLLEAGFKKVMRNGIHIETQSKGVTKYYISLFTK